MNTLFPVDDNTPPGFLYHPGFIDAHEENLLLAICRQEPLHAMQFRGYTAKREVVSYEYDWNFDTRSLHRGKTIPATYKFLVGRLAQLKNIQSDTIGELLITRYPPGAVINWHRDAPAFEMVAGLSLLSDCALRFRPHEAAKQNRKSMFVKTVKRCSLYIMEGESRWDWEHSIMPLKQERYSITLRTLRKNVHVS